MSAITEIVGVSKFVWIAIWFIRRYVEMHPILTAILGLTIVFVFIPAIENRVRSIFNKEHQGCGIFIWEKTGYQQYKSIILSVVLSLAVAQVAYLFGFFSPSKKIDTDDVAVLLLPVFELDSSGRFKVTEDSEHIQAEIKGLLTADGVQNEVILVERSEYPFRAYTPTTMNHLVEKISANSTNNYFYLYAIKRGDKYEKFSFLISPGGEAEPGKIKDRDFYQRYSNTFSQLLNSSGDVPQTAIIQFSSSIFSAVLSQAHTKQYTEYGMYQAAEDGVANAYTIATRTCRNMRKNQFINNMKVAIGFCDDLVKDLALYKKLAIENNLERKAALIYVTLQKKPFAPYETEKQYIKWLTSQEEYNYYGRYIPVGGWIRLNSSLEKYIGYLAFSSPNEVPINKLSEELDKIIPGKSWVKSYYLFVVSSIRHDIDGMRNYQRALAAFDQSSEVVEKAAILIKARDEIKAHN